MEGLIELGRQQSPVIVLAATWDHIDGADRVAGKIGAPLAVMPASSLAVEEAAGYMDLMEFLCHALETARSDS